MQLLALPFCLTEKPDQLFDLSFPICCLYFVSSLYSVFNVLLTGGDEQIRTVDPLLARQVLSQLSYTPVLKGLVGPSGLEPPTLRLSVVRSSQLSYGPIGLAEDTFSSTF